MSLGKTRFARNSYVAILMLICIGATVAAPMGCTAEPLEPSPTEVESTTTPSTSGTLQPSPTVQSPTATASVATPTTETSTTIPPTASPTSSPQEPSVTPTFERIQRDLDIVTLLPFDAIPAINDPTFFETVEDADRAYGEDELILGVEIDGDARAYSVPLLSSHEIVNDIVGGHPIAVTW